MMNHRKLLYHLDRVEDFLAKIFLSLLEMSPCKRVMEASSPDIIGFGMRLRLKR